MNRLTASDLRADPRIPWSDYGLPVVSTTLTSPVDAVATTIHVALATGFPSSSFTILVESETMTVTGGYGSLDWTVVRGVAASAHGSGAAVKLQPDPLDAEIEFAWEYVEEKTGRDLDTIDPSDNLAVIAERAVKYRVIQQAIYGQATFFATSIGSTPGSGSGGIKSFTVPGYSETRFDPNALLGRSAKSRVSAERAGTYFNEWPILNDLLWLLATQAKRDEVQAAAAGEFPPASDIQEVDWGYPAGRVSDWLRIGSLGP